MNPDKLTFFMFVTALLPWAVVVAVAINAKRIPFNIRRIITPLLWLGSVVLLYLCWKHYADLHPNWDSDHIIPEEDIGALVVATVLLSTVVSGLICCFIAVDNKNWE